MIATLVQISSLHKQPTPLSGGDVLFMFFFFFFFHDLEEDEKQTEGLGRSDTDREIIRQWETKNF